VNDSFSQDSCRDDGLPYLQGHLLCDLLLHYQPKNQFMGDQQLQCWP